VERLNTGNFREGNLRDWKDGLGIEAPRGLG
jgi:hypothetical protein